MLWADPTFACFPQLHKDACEHGVRHGVSLAVHDTCGQVSMVSLIRRERVLGADEFCLKAGQCLLLVNMLHQRLGGHLFNALDSSPSHLSSRELEMLRWSAQGKTAGDIGAILSLSERTVNFHINNAVKKLGMNNKISAVVHVAQTGML
jgi:LuxR family transcriptional regulator